MRVYICGALSQLTPQFRYTIKCVSKQSKSPLKPSVSASIAATLTRSHSASEMRSASASDMFCRPQTATNPLRVTLSASAVSNQDDAALPPRRVSGSTGSRGATTLPPTASSPQASVASAESYSVKRIGVCSGHSSYVTHVDFSRDSTLMRSCDGANEILFWGVPDCAQNPRTISLKDISWATSTVVFGWDVRSIWPSGSDGTDINAIDVSRDGDAVITADDNGHVKLFRYPAAGDAQCFKAYLGHSSHVMNARFSPDGHRAFTCGGIDAAVIQWRHCDRLISPPDDLHWLDAKSTQTHVFTIVVHSGREGGSFDSIWVELIGPNMRAPRQTLSEKSAIKDALNLSAAATSLPKNTSVTFTVSVPTQLTHVVRLGFGFVGKSSSFCDVEKIAVLSPSGEQSEFWARRCLDSYATDIELLPGAANCAALTLRCMTGDLFNAGTDGSVYVCLFDAAGNSTGLRRLRTTESRSMFQRKQTDVCELFCNPPFPAVASLNVLLEPKVHQPWCETCIAQPHAVCRESDLLGTWRSLFCRGPRHRLYPAMKMFHTLPRTPG